MHRSDSLPPTTGWTRVLQRMWPERRSFSNCGRFHVELFYNVFWSCCCPNRIRIVLLHAAYNTMSQKHGLQCHVSMVELSITIGNQWIINCHWPGRINKVSKHVASMDDCNNACVPVWVLDPVNHQNTDWERLWSKAAARTITKLQVGGSWSWGKKYRR